MRPTPASLGGLRWDILVSSPKKRAKAPEKKAHEETARVEAPGRVEAKMPAPAPMRSVPYMSQEPEDLHTRVIMLGSLARCHERTRNFWASAWANHETVHPPVLEMGDLARGDVLFVSREDSLLSQGIRFWTQSPFNHACIMKSATHLVETDPVRGFMTHAAVSYVERIAKDNFNFARRPFGIWVVRPAAVPDSFDELVARVSLDGYDAESVLQNMIHTGNSDGPDHPIPFPWESSLPLRNDHIRIARAWEERESFSCAELIARLLELDPVETFQWIPSSLFAKLLSTPGATVYRLNTTSVQEATAARHYEKIKSHAEAALAQRAQRAAGAQGAQGAHGAQGAQRAPEDHPACREP